MTTEAPRMVEGVLQGTPQAVGDDLVKRTERAGSVFWLATAVFGGLFLLGIVAFAVLLTGGTSDRSRWGYYTATVAFLLTTAQAAPLVSVGLRAVKAHWIRPIARAAELYAFVGILNLLMFIPLLWVLPVTDGRRSIWFDWPGHSPHVYDTIAMASLAITGVALLYIAALPDMALAGRKMTGRRGALLRKLSMNWVGSAKQWRMQMTGIGMVGGMYFMLLVFTHFLFASDFAEGLVPGWRDALFPAWHAQSALQSGVAVVMVTMFIMRTFGGYKEYLGLNQFWSLSKVLLALSLLWVYFWFSGFIIQWYGRQPSEQDFLRMFFFERYRVPFLVAIMLNFVAPFAVLLWNGVRKSIVGPTIAAVFILVGTLFDRIRIYVGSFSVEDPTTKTLGALPNTVTPGTLDILLIVGGISGAIFLYLLATRVVPLVSIWQSKEGLLYVMVKPLLKGRYLFLGKPD